jgi:hypothetical protein
VSIRCDLYHPAFAAILKIIRSEGWEPSATELFGDERARLHKFHVEVDVTYTDEELDACDYLMVDRWGGVLAHAEEADENGTVIANAASVGEFSGQGWTMRYGFIDKYHYFVNPEIREVFDQAGFVGLSYKPIFWNVPSMVKGEYWQLMPTVLMPPCQTPVRDCQLYLKYEEGPYQPAELRYHRRDVESLGIFDAALTREDTPYLSRPYMGKHHMIVSQRFRQVCKQLGLDVRYSPVRLDAPPRSLPWFFTSDTPPSGVSPR